MAMETGKLDRIRESVENLTKASETLLAQADGFPSLEQNTKRIQACIRMMQIALGQVTMRGQ
jgi:hypothetical protein